tara:strand:+ start:226 stop:522 length:297 start_codon:yes stop_codon:yes gene_type:complete
MYMIYGVTDCPHCLRAQALCMEKDVDYAWVMMDWSKTYRERIKSIYNWKTYPIVTKIIENPIVKKLIETGRWNDDPDYIEDLVGGFDELQLELLSNEE